MGGMSCKRERRPTDRPNESMKNLLFLLPLLVFNLSGEAESLFDKLAVHDTTPFTIIGSGFVTDGTHPWHPGYFKKYDMNLRLSMNPELGEAIVTLEWKIDGKADSTKYYTRRDRLFAIDKDGKEKYPEEFCDLSAATIAGLHPEIVAYALLERRENVEPDHADGHLFAWNEELWSVATDKKTGRILSLQRRLRNERYGDGSEQIHYDVHSTDSDELHPKSVSVTRRGREIARFDFGAIQRQEVFEFPSIDRERDRTWVVSARDIKFDEFAPHIFKIDLDSLNHRLVVAEFIDFLVVLEGAFNSRLCDVIAQKVNERFQKPVKYFAFSHLHGQYVGGVRSWVKEEATIVVPPTTVPLIEEMVKTPFELNPDALSREPRPLQIATAKEGRRIDDETNALEIYNVESEHTDEYFIFYFPRQKVLLTGDLLFYRPGQTPAIKGRSKKLCETVQKLGLDVETYVCTWPLTGYDTKNIVSKAEMLEACGN